MASLNFSEKEYGAVVGAALLAFTRGHKDDAMALNELASKMNAGLTRAKYPAHGGLAAGRGKFKAPGPLDEQLGVKR